MAKIPEFKSEQEESEFWDSHEATEFFEETTPVAMEFVDVRPRKTLISLRLDPGTIAALKQAAHRRGMGYQTLIRMWVLEKLAAEPANAGGGSAAPGDPPDRRSSGGRVASTPDGPRRRESDARLRR
jgi:predicted DNA binding CopG/RHH family protein